MKTRTKAIGILLVLTLAIYYNLPTLQSLLPGQAERNQAELKQTLGKLQTGIEELRGLEMAWGNPKENSVTIMHEEGKRFPLTHPSFHGLLEPFTLEEGATTSSLKVKEGKDVFVTKVAAELNSIFSHIRKIEGVSYSEEQEALLIKVAKNKRLSEQVEPLKSLFADSLELAYLEDSSSYIARVKENEIMVNLGLDLQGGMYQDIGVDTDKVVESFLQNTALALEDRLIEESINYSMVEVIGEKTIEILLDDNESVDLEADNYKGVWFNEFEATSVGNGFLLDLKPQEEVRVREKAIQQALETIRNRIDMLGVKEPSIQRQGTDSIVIQLPGLKDPDRARRVIGQVAVLEFMMVAKNGNPDRLKKGQAIYLEEERDTITKEVLQTRTHVLNTKVMLTGDMIRDARVSFTQTNESYVGMSFNDQGKEIFADVTRENVGQQMAIVLDGKVQSAPVIQSAIEGGEAQITGNFSPEEATELALVLRSGALPAPIVINEERTVGASLGEDSIRQALLSLALGFVMVILFMAVYYQMSGIFSVMVLFFNLLLIVAAMAYLGATLTLPGMAGIVLTIGMAVDANVLIFERIREELNLGKPPRAAIQIGFSKATVTILDANITTILAAIVLYQFGTGPIKGFAITLSLGIAASIFTAIVVGRFLFEIYYLRRQRLDTISI